MEGRLTHPCAVILVRPRRKRRRCRRRVGGGPTRLRGCDLADPWFALAVIIGHRTRRPPLCDPPRGPMILARSLASAVREVFVYCRSRSSACAGAPLADFQLTADHRPYDCDLGLTGRRIDPARTMQATHLGQGQTSSARSPAEPASVRCPTRQVSADEMRRWAPFAPSLNCPMPHWPMARRPRRASPRRYGNDRSVDEIRARSRGP